MSPFLNWLRRTLLDERHLLHRYKSTSHAAVAAAIVLGGWFGYDLLVRDVVRWDFVIVMIVMLLVKLISMVWYRMRD